MTVCIEGKRYIDHSGKKSPQRLFSKETDKKGANVSGSGEVRSKNRRWRDLVI